MARTIRSADPHRFVAYGSPHLRGACARCGRNSAHKNHCYHYVVGVARRIYSWSLR